MKKNSLAILVFVLSLAALPCYAFSGPAGQPWVFGENCNGQLGIGIADNGTAHPYPAMPIGVGNNVIKACFGQNRSVLLLADGTILVCGQNTNGELGDGTQIDATSFVPMPGLDNVKDIAIAVGSGRGIAAVKSDGTLWLWGTTIPTADGWAVLDHPLQIESLNKVIAVTMGWYQLWAVKSDGTVWRVDYGWGLPPIQEEGLQNIVAVAAGLDHQMALDAEGGVWTWGNNSFGQLGTGMRKQRRKPYRALRNAIAIAADYFHCVALKSNGTLWRWGGFVWDDNGFVKSFKRPLRVKTDLPIISIAAGEYSVYFVKNDGTLWSYGQNAAGQHGDGTTEFTKIPVKAVGLENVIAVFSGYNSTLALTAPTED